MKPVCLEVLLRAILWPMSQAHHQSLAKQTAEIKAAHQHSAVTDHFKEVVYGGIDGIITTFAVVAGFTGAAVTGDATTQLSFSIMLLFGLANLFADATSMGLGNFLSVRSEHDLYHVKREKEKRLLAEDTEAELKETALLLEHRGFSKEDSVAIANLYKNNGEYWLDFMMTHEHELTDPRRDNPLYTGLATFISFIIFGAVPLIPFMLTNSGDTADVFLFSLTGTFLALTLLGLLKWQVIGTRLSYALLEVLTVGGVAAAIAYFVGTFFAI